MTAQKIVHRQAWPSFFQKGYFFHVLFWIMYAVFMIMEVQVYARKKDLLFCISPLLIYFALMALLVYGNTLLLIPLLVVKRKIGLYITGVIFIIIFYTYFRSLNQQYWDAIVWPDEPMTLQSYFHWSFIYAIWFLIISSMLFFTQQWSEQQQKVKNTEINQLQTELKYLRSQVNPHFLFNGLNTIYGNIDIKDQKARETLLLFSDLLRYSLYEADIDLVDLQKEAQHLDNYVALQKMRSDKNVQIDVDIKIEFNTIKIAPLIFMPFTENAFKYCSRDDNGNNYIKIRLQQTGNTITFHCSNTYKEHQSNKKGIGLANVKRRLELLYKERYSLNIHKDDKIFSVDLTLDT